jgi:hypothetical protein
MTDSNDEKKAEPGAKAPSKWLNLKNLLIATIISLCIAFAGLIIWTKKGAKHPKQPSASVFQKMSAPYRSYSAPQNKAMPERVSPQPERSYVPTMPHRAFNTGVKAGRPVFKPITSAKNNLTPVPTKYPTIQSPAPQPTKNVVDKEILTSPRRKNIKVYDSDSVSEGGIFTEKNGEERPVNSFR